MFEQLPENSKVWVYQADRELNSSEESFLLENLKIFIQDWAAHGSQLYGDVAIKDMRFVILAVDESKTGVSGCSIDTSVRKIKAVAAEKVVVAPLEAIPPIDERYLADALESVPLIKGDNVMVPY